MFCARFCRFHRSFHNGWHTEGLYSLQAMHTHTESDCILFVTGPARTFIYDLFLSFTVVTKSAVYYILSFFCLYLGLHYTVHNCEV